MFEKVSSRCPCLRTLQSHGTVHLHGEPCSLLLPPAQPQPSSQTAQCLSFPNSSPSCLPRARCAVLGLSGTQLEHHGHSLPAMCWGSSTPNPKMCPIPLPSGMLLWEMNPMHEGMREGSWMQDAALVLQPQCGGAQSLPGLSSSSSAPCTSALMVFLHPRGSGCWFCSLCPVPRGEFAVWGDPRWAPGHGTHPPAAPRGFQRLTAAGNTVASIKGARWDTRSKQGAARLYFYHSQQNGQLESELNAGPQLCPKPPSRLKRE